jgi:hypothetical protein
MENKTQFIHTYSGSIYEVDSTLHRARRLIGNGPPTERVGDTWREYARLELEVGQSMVFIWEFIIKENEIPIAKSTITSKVLKITETLEVQ